MKTVIICVKNSMIIILILIAFFLLSWMAYSFLGLEIIKVFGPVFTSFFMVYIAYKQLNISASQKEMSKQQADIAQRKVELDIRDRRYEVFRRWNEAYFFFRDHVNTDVSDTPFFAAKNGLLTTLDEIFYSFGQNILINDNIEIIKNCIKKIEEHRQSCVYYLNSYFDGQGGVHKCGPSPFASDVSQIPDYNVWESTCSPYDNLICKELQEIADVKQVLVSIIMPEMKIL